MAQEIDWRLFDNNPVAQQQQGFDYAQHVHDVQLQQQVGALAADGRCAEARDTAARGGDIDLAQRAYAFCMQERQ